MATRSEIIQRAQGKIIQGESDSMWTNINWSDFFQTACDMIHKELVEADLGYFITEVDLTPTGDVYTLPEDVYVIKGVRLNEYPLYERSLREEEQGLQGFRTVNNTLKIINITPAPAVLTLIYVATPTEFNDWTGVADPITSVPQAPLNTRAGMRLLSEIIAYLARTRDGGATPAQSATVEGMIANFVDRMGTRVQNDSLNTGIDI